MSASSSTTQRPRLLRGDRRARSHPRLLRVSPAGLQDAGEEEADDAERVLQAEAEGDLEVGGPHGGRP